jgi:hypothetical protein
MIETQQTIGDWAKETLPGGDDLSYRHCIRLLEGVAELCKATGATQGECLLGLEAACSGMRLHSRDPATPEKVAAKLADCEIVLRVLAERHCVDLKAGVDGKMKINWARSWKSNGDGTSHHVKPSAG